ncbi:kelch repeat-containing protein [Sediminibacterium sp.]|uniref:Kelch repeat-containing protein n=1 Tax=Sediminibacterium sp. TaxID=1917865 RepID=UPI002736627E|nr:kelch repeat-containing protein [Sediminibacterium sp.]MDP3567349.1 kelch repeat-containing protein [Sediminibacterium sp.]
MKLFFTFFLFTNILFGQTWVQLAGFPGTERDDGVAVRINNKAYFGTGLLAGFTLGNDFYAYDLATNTWSAIASMPTGSERQYACAFTSSNSFYILSGSGYSNAVFTDLQRYDVATNTWTVLTGKPGNGLIGASCLEYGDKIIIVGGKLQSGVVSDEVWEYTISTDTWLQKNNFPFGGRWRASTTVLNNIGYLLFGKDNNQSVRKEMYTYNNLTDTWVKLMDFPLPKGRSYAALNTANSRLVLFGGYDTLNYYYNDVWYYNDLSGLWQLGPNLPSFGRKGGMSFTNTDKFYYSCGINVSNTRLNETWVIDIPVGIKENSLGNNFLIYPNPAKDILNLKSEIEDVAAVMVQVYNTIGQLIKQEEIIFKDKTSSIKTEGLPNGVYLLKVFDTNKSVNPISVSKRIVIAR